jgi:SAM-dependent methyltransferase
MWLTRNRGGIVARSDVGAATAQGAPGPPDYQAAFAPAQHAAALGERVFAQFPQPAQEYFSGLPVRRILLPGCGAALDLPALSELGHHLMAVDFSPEAVALARVRYPGVADCIVEADFFKLDCPPFDCIFERAMLCALPPARRDAYIAKVATLLKSDGVLAGLFFVADKPKGPPYGVPMPELQALMHRHGFALVQHSLLDSSLPVFSGCEFWMVWSLETG